MNRLKQPLQIPSRSEDGGRCTPLFKNTNDELRKENYPRYVLPVVNNVFDETLLLLNRPVSIPSEILSGLISDWSTLLL